MSSLSGWYKGVDGISAFVAGVASTLADEKLAELLPRLSCLETDVFEANRENLCQKFSERIHLYKQFGRPDKSAPVRELKFELETISKSPQECVEGMVWGMQGLDLRPCDHETGRRMIYEFFDGIEFQLGKAKAVHLLRRPFEKAVEKAISDHYVYIIFHVYFVEYDDYFLMLAFGSNE